jgi:hypothetical protein
MLAGMILRSGAQASNKLRDTMLESFRQTARERVRADPAIPLEASERVYQGQALIWRPADEAAERFMAFAEISLTEWRKTAAHTTEDGVAVAAYTARYTPRVVLEPRSYWAGRVTEDPMRRRRDGRRIEARVPYRYHLHFALEPRSEKSTLATYRTVEAVDPDLSCGYDLTRHFEAPAMPGGFGRQGERCLAWLAR